MKDHVDMKDLDLATKTLRDHALVGLAQWLDVQQPEIIKPTQEAQETLLFLLNTSEDLTRVERKKFKRLKERFLMTDVPDLSLGQQRWMVGHLPRRYILDFLTALKDWRSRKKGTLRDLGPIAAPDLRDAVAQSAWAAPSFRRDVLNVLRSHARARVIMHPEGPLPPALAKQTLWAAATQGCIATGLSSPPQAEDLLQDRLMAIAALGFSESGWAGFWDGYILTRPQPKEIFKELKLLINLSNDIAISEEYRLNWRDESPAYVKQLLGDTI